MVNVFDLPLAFTILTCQLKSWFWNEKERKKKKGQVSLDAKAIESNNKEEWLLSWKSMPSSRLQPQKSANKVKLIYETRNKK